MRQGTTPQITFNLPFATSSITKLSIVVMQNGEIIAERDLTNTTLGTETLVITLTEAETLKLEELGKVYMQIRCGMGTQRLASNIMETDASIVLKGGLLA